MKAALPNRQPARILIVENESAIAAHLYRLLRSWDYEVAGIAPSAVQAMRLIVRHPPDLAILSLHLAGPATGASLMPALHRRQVPLILLTGYEAAELPHDWLNRPGVLYLPKPFLATQLRTAVAQLLGPPPAMPGRNYP